MELNQPSTVRRQKLSFTCTRVVCVMQSQQDSQDQNHGTALLQNQYTTHVPCVGESSILKLYSSHFLVLFGFPSPLCTELVVERGIYGRGKGQIGISLEEEIFLSSLIQLSLIHI